MAMIFGMDVDDLFRRKRTVQQIYNASYRFAKPPEKPVVKAIAADGRVTLYWDDSAERTFDAFYQKYNFEGYRVYRSTEPNFLESKIITDAFGKATYRKPIAQFDVVDGMMGLHPVDVNGALFYLGDDSGLEHSFIDSTVQNGQTYYYAVVSYDQGFTTTTIEGEFLGIPPSECTSIIKVDINGRVKTDVNTAAVTPRVRRSGMSLPSSSRLLRQVPARGRWSTDSRSGLSPANHSYEVGFIDSTAFHTASNPFYFLVDLTTGDTLITPQRMPSKKVTTPVIDGFSVTIDNDQSVLIDRETSGWEDGLDDVCHGGRLQYGVRAGSARAAPRGLSRRFRDPVHRPGAGNDGTSALHLFTAESVECGDPEPDGGSVTAWPLCSSTRTTMLSWTPVRRSSLPSAIPRESRRPRCPCPLHLVACILQGYDDRRGGPAPPRCRRCVSDLHAQTLPDRRSVCVPDSQAAGYDGHRPSRT